MRRIQQADMIGKTFGRLTCVERVKNRGSLDRYRFVCEDGNEIEANGHDIRNGNTSSCGCLQKQRVREALITHGQTASGRWTPEYRAWAGMIDRCRNPAYEHYEYYGGKGIQVCERWRNSFAAFFLDMGLRPGKGYSIDRVDNDKNYEPGNCRWATQREQTRNKSNNVYITHNGETMILTDWSERLGIDRHRLRRRLLGGMTFEEAISKPPQNHGEHHLISHDGEKMNLSRWAARLKINGRTLTNRMKIQKLSFEEAISRPIKKRKPFTPKEQS